MSDHRLPFRRPPFSRRIVMFSVLVLAFVAGRSAFAADADMILHGGKIVTVDNAFSVSEAIAIKGGRIVAIGRSADVLGQERGPQTQVIDLKGKTVIPGLTDSHVHPLGAAMSELTNDYALLKSFDDIRAYIREQAKKTPKGEWIYVPKTFPARLKELRMPTRDVLDATLDHPVFYDASYASAVNSYALKMRAASRGRRKIRRRRGRGSSATARGNRTASSRAVRRRCSRTCASGARNSRISSSSTRSKPS
jgi:predicted amidohydrolase YtcJ